ncbi:MULTISPECIES: MFS transporter [Virgibacillus]|uniref:Major facilitator superfamily (MFS) profile domain-containing protein n=1 Tax=Virgibacillus pantothenticus TaxID=1473 RepID=A0A0L0QLS5_VIRPA|nr:MULTISPECIES: MFS transporter [Virgibacillus]API91464.1 hypothetical protein BKP57_06175 [Virgibacillus sp. 6R]KNE19223.1 hypothetical protein AFK71_11865 [Virgibacillus pantothenticus]MBS7427437.1 MFS transporter [Virgibacillus sp. 19R1-5]MED3738647.1 MFS transporter [Virgibacillus pantothenticus]QTY15688.1 MFS transporter [Virgibacillus pantothenticus]
MIKYILLSGIYRFFCGAIILAINWNLAIGDNSNFISLAIAVLFSFIPAIFVPVLFRQLFNRYQGPFLTSVSLIGVVISCILLSSFYTSNTLLIIINFLIWIFFFMMETTWETWFVDLSKNYSEKAVSKYSSISMTVNQVALMSGPLAAPFIIDNLSYELFFYLMALTFFSVSVMSYFQKVPNNGNKVTNIEGDTKKINLYLFFSLVLVWPTLGSINFMLPVYVTINNGNMLNVGILDACISIGMALIGIVFSTLKVNDLRIRTVLSFTSILAGFTTWWFSGYSIVGNAIGILLLGFGFGGLRIMIRYVLARNYTPQDVAKLVSRANALSLPVLGIVLASVMISIRHTWTAPFILSIIMCMFLTLGLMFEQKRKEQNQYQESNLAK